MTAIALIICRLPVITDATGLSYHGEPVSSTSPPTSRPTPAHDGAYHFVTYAVEPWRRPSRHQDVGSIKGASLPRRSWYGIAGAVLLIASGAIHLDLYVTGYQSIPTIGWLFLLQVITAFVLAIAIPLTGSWVLAGVGAGFALSPPWAAICSRSGSACSGSPRCARPRESWPGSSTWPPSPRWSRLATCARSRAESRPAPGWPPPGPGRAGGGQRSPARCCRCRSPSPKAQPAPGAATTAGRPGAAGRRRGPGSSPTPTGFTLYWFAPDTRTSPSATALRRLLAAGAGNPAAGPGVTGKVGTITRTDGTPQATYDGHPLYTYVGDNAPGQARGNNINLNGGLWHDVPVAGG